MAEEYPEDEFDRLARDRKVIGAHREPESNRSWWLAGLAVLVLAPLIGWAFVHFGGADSVSEQKWPTDQVTTSAAASAEPSATAEESESAESEPSAAESAEASASASAEASAEPSESASAEPSESASAEAEEAETAGLATEVRVLNGSRVNGLAATKQQALSSAGFTNVVASNYQGGSSPQYSTIYYAREADAETAQQVGQAIGVSNVVYSPQSVVGGQGIVVVLRSDSAN